MHKGLAAKQVMRFEKHTMRTNTAYPPAVSAGNGLVSILCLLIAGCMLLSSAGMALALDDIPTHRTRTDPGCHTEGVYPATVRIRNEYTTTGYSVEICTGEETEFIAPRVVLQPGFKAHSGSRFRAGLPVIDVQIVVVEQCATYPDYTGSPSPPNPNPGTCAVGTGRHFLDPQDLGREIELLNSNFYAANRDQLVRFRLKSVTEWNDIVAAGMTGDDLVQYITDDAHCYGDVDCDGDGTNDNYGTEINDAFNATPNNILRDHDAVNFYIYNSRFLDPDTANYGHGRRNGNSPYILIDYDRFDVPEPEYRPVDHEMGHAFGLGHTCSEAVTSNSITSNLMNSSGYCGSACSGDLAGSSMGDRELGLEYESYVDCSACSSPPCDRKDQQYYRSSEIGYGQVEMVLWYALEIAQEFGLINGSLPIRVP